MKGKTDRLIRLRKALKLSQSDLAQKVKVSRVTIGNWESDDDMEIGGEKLLRLATALKTTPAYIVFGKDITAPPSRPQDAVTAINDALFELVIAGVIKFEKNENPKEAAKHIYRKVYGQDSLDEEQPDLKMVAENNGTYNGKS